MIGRGNRGAFSQPDNVQLWIKEKKFYSIRVYASRVVLAQLVHFHLDIMSSLAYSYSHQAEGQKMTRSKKILIILLAFLSCLMADRVIFGAILENPEEKILDRAAEAAKNRQKKLGQTENPFALTDPDIALIKDKLFYGEILGKGSLDEKQEALIILACLTATQGLDELSVQVESALRIGVDPISIKEAIYQCAPYTGFPKVEAAITRVNKVFAQNDIRTPLPGQGVVDEKSRFAEGLAKQTSIFGDHIKAMHESASNDEKKIVVNMLTAYCFGDFYTRNGLDIKMRELVVFSVINAIGGCEPQAKAHAQANLNVGNTRQNLIDAIALMLPFTGFPRTLNALACVNAVCKEDAAPEKSQNAGEKKEKNSVKK